MKRAEFVRRVALAAGELYDRVVKIAARDGARSRKVAIAELTARVNDSLGRKRKPTADRLARETLLEHGVELADLDPPPPIVVDIPSLVVEVEDDPEERPTPRREIERPRARRRTELAPPPDLEELEERTPRRRGRSGKPPEFGMRRVVEIPQKPQPTPPPDNEYMSSEELAEAIAAAESDKMIGSLPDQMSSSWTVGPDREGGLAVVTELGDGAP